MNGTTSPNTPVAGTASSTGQDPRSAHVLAKTLFRDLKTAGLPRATILEVASELTGLAHRDPDGPTR